MQRIARHLSLLLVLVCLPNVRAEEHPIDWPTFQGNNARTGLCGYPPIFEPAIAWSTQVGIMGYLNCPVIDGDRVYVTSSGDKHNEPDQRDGVYCLDMKTGEVLWHYPTSSDACGITIDRQHVYAGDDAGMFQAVDRETGELVWQYEFNDSVFGQPLRVGDLIIAGDAKGFINAFDPKTGKKRWSFHHDDTLRAGLSSDGEQIYALYLHGQLACFDLKGNTRWVEEKPVGNWHPLTEFYACPTLVSGQVYFTYALGFSNLPKLGSFDSNGNQTWVNGPDAPANDLGKNFANIRSSPAAYKGSLLYAECYGNKLVRVNKGNGGFDRSIALGAPMFPHWPSPVIAQATLYIARHDGGLYAVDLQENKKVWMLYLGEHTQAGQAVLPKNIMPEGWDHCAWDPGVGRPIYATPAIAKDGTVVIGSGEGWLYCIKEKQDAVKP